MRDIALGQADLEAELRPETPLERELLRVPDLVRGMFWGTPRYGHPEGEVYKHIKDILANIDRLPAHLCNADTRRRLRLIAYVHDSFKYCEDKSHPRDWSQHHGMLARRFLEAYTDDRHLLDIVELHDEAYYCWRITFLYHDSRAGAQRLQELLHRIKPVLQLYYLFFKCDTLTGDKNLAPLRWFEQTIEEIEIAPL